MASDELRWWSACRKTIERGALRQLRRHKEPFALLPTESTGSIAGFSSSRTGIDISAGPAIWLRSKGGLKVPSINCRSIGPHGNVHKSPKNSIHRPREGAVQGAAPAPLTMTRSVTSSASTSPPPTGRRRGLKPRGPEAFELLLTCVEGRLDGCREV